MAETGSNLEEEKKEKGHKSKQEKLNIHQKEKDPHQNVYNGFDLDKKET